MSIGNGLIISAPSSASGKTTITLGLLRAIRNRKIDIRSAKSGPDYIDPRFHAKASGQECINLDAWAMTPQRIQTLASGQSTLIVEGAMGLFDGAPPIGKGSTSDLAKILNLPVVLVLDVASQAQSVAALAAGFANHDPDVKIAGFILNKVGSPRHDLMLRHALEPLNIPVLGSVFRNKELVIPSRHLGLVQAMEQSNLDGFLNLAANEVENSIDIDALLELCQPISNGTTDGASLPPLAQSIAIASDAAFAFTYPHLLNDWRKHGAEISFFSPLADEAPKVDADLVYLPGGYPELHAGKIAQAAHFKQGMAKATAVYGECGGYMTMGKSLIDADGKPHEMLGLLDLVTSFEHRKLHLGYRKLTPNALWSHALSGHEFHYASTISAKGDPLFTGEDAQGNILGELGLINGNYTGSFAHVIDRYSP